MDVVTILKAKPWHYEYTYHVNPKLDPSGVNHDQIAATMKQLDFTTQRAMDFKAGWEAAMNNSMEAIKGVQQQLTNLVEVD